VHRTLTSPPTETARVPRCERDEVRAVPSGVPEERRRGCGVHPVPGGADFLGGSHLHLGVPLLRCRQLPQRDILAVCCVPGRAEFFSGSNFSRGVLLPCGWGVHQLRLERAAGGARSAQRLRGRGVRWELSSRSLRQRASRSRHGWAPLLADIASVRRLGTGCLDQSHSPTQKCAAN